MPRVLWSDHYYRPGCAQQPSDWHGDLWAALVLRRPFLQLLLVYRLPVFLFRFRSYKSCHARFTYLGSVRSIRTIFQFFFNSL